MGSLSSLSLTGQLQGRLLVLAPAFFCKEAFDDIMICERAWGALTVHRLIACRGLWSVGPLHLPFATESLDTARAWAGCRER